MKSGFFLLILIAFTLSTLGRSFAFAGQDQVVKIEISHSHDSDHHFYPNEHSHESAHVDHEEQTDHHHETSTHESDSGKHQHTHTHEILVCAGHSLAVLSKATFLPFDYVKNQFPLAFTQGHLLERPLDSIFRPPIYV